MKNATPLAFGLILVLLVSLCGCQKTVTSNVLEQHEAMYPDLKKKYVYQSLIRLANVNRDPNFEKLIKDIRKIVLYLPPRNDSTYQIQTVKSGMHDDGYELLVEGRTSDQTRMSLWVKEDNASAHYVALVDAEEEDVILEVDGQINIEYLMAIEMADSEMLQGLIDQGF